MFAIVRELTHKPGERERVPPLAREFQELRARQPGYRGGVTVDAGEGRMLIVALFETQDQAMAAGKVLEPEAQRLMGEAWAGPPRIVASGQVVHEDLPRA